MSLKNALIDWSGVEYPRDFEDRCFAIGYATAIGDVLDYLRDTGIIEANIPLELTQTIARMEDTDEPLGN